MKRKLMAIVLAGAMAFSPTSQMALSAVEAEEVLLEDVESEENLEEDAELAEEEKTTVEDGSAASTEGKDAAVDKGADLIEDMDSVDDSTLTDGLESVFEFTEEAQTEGSSETEDETEFLTDIEEDVLSISAGINEEVNIENAAEEVDGEEAMLEDISETSELQPQTMGETAENDLLMLAYSEDDEDEDDENEDDEDDQVSSISSNAILTLKYYESKQTVEAGSNVTLQCPKVVSCMGEVSYQWYAESYNSDTYELGYYPIDNETDASYVLNNIQSSTRLYCLVMDSCRSEKVWFVLSVKDDDVKDAKTVKIGDYTSEYEIEAGESVRLSLPNVVSHGGELHYQWYIYDELTGQYQKIEGEEAYSYTLDNVMERTDLYCLVSEDGYESREAYFDVFVEGELSLGQYDSRYDISYGESVTVGLENASSSTGLLSYRWYDEEGKLIDAAVEASYTLENVQKDTKLICRVTDGVQMETVSFYIDVVKDNELKVYREGTYYRKVEPNGSTTLSVSASCKTGQLTYEWFEYSQSLEGETDSSLVLTGITSASQYDCKVTDIYGNSEIVTFSVLLDNQFSAEMVSEERIQVAPHGSVRLEVAASCSMGAISYEWSEEIYREGEDHDRHVIVSATANTLVLTDVTDTAWYYCWVSDCYGNLKQLEFIVTVDSNLTLENNTDTDRWLNETVYVAYGKSIVLSAAATTNSDKPLIYTWKRNGSVLQTGATATYQLGNVYSHAYVNCTVDDGYTTKIVYFTVYCYSSLIVPNRKIDAYYGDSAVLSVKAYTTQNAVLSYQWYKLVYPDNGQDEDEDDTEAVSILIEGATSASFAIDSVTKSETYKCVVSDGTSEKEANINVNLCSAFSAEAYASAVKISEDGSAVLRVKSKLYDSNATLNFKWYRDEANGAVLLPGENDNVLKLRDLSAELGQYYCLITDNRGQTVQVQFAVYQSSYLVDEEDYMDAIELKLDETITGHCIDGARSQFCFTPDSTGYYRFTMISSSESMAYGLYYMPEGEWEYGLNAVIDNAYLYGGTQYLFEALDTEKFISDFTITVTKASGLTAVAAKNAVPIGDDGTAVLVVNAENDASVGGSIQYNWYYLNGQQKIMLNTIGNSLSLANVSASRMYYCEVKDKEASIILPILVYRAEDISPDREDARLLSAGNVTGILVNDYCENYWLKIQPSETSTYTIYSVSDNNLTASLHNADYKWLGYYDDGGVDKNFSLTRVLNAGETYYLWISANDLNADNALIPFTICMKKEHQHTVVIDPAVAATCTSTGKTVGSHCSECGEIILAQTVTEKLAHSWSAWIDVSTATVFAKPKHSRTCSVCGAAETKEYGSVLSSSGTVSASSFALKLKQKTTKLTVTDMAAGDYVKSWKSSNKTLVKVKGKADGTSTVTAGAKKTGTAKITITLASGKVMTVKVKVQKTNVTTKKLSANLGKKVTMKKGASLTIQPIVTPITSTDKVKYTTSNKKIVTVSSKGVIKAKKVGKAKVTVSSGKQKYAITITVKKK